MSDLSYLFLQCAGRKTDNYGRIPYSYMGNAQRDECE